MRSLVLVGFGAGLEDPNFGALRAWMAETWSSSEYRHFRLVRADERDAVAAQHRPEERIVTVVYGDSHDDLAPFLRTLRPMGPAPAAVRAPTGETAVLPAARPCFGREALIETLVVEVTQVEPVAVAVLGPPGIGKSALSLAAAYDERVVERFGERRYWVRCDGSTSAAGLVAEIAGVVGSPLTETGVESALVRKLADAPALLVLDNAETPWTADTLATEDLLSRLATVPGLALVCSFRGSQRPVGPAWADSVAVPPLASASARELFTAAAGSRFANDPHLDELLSDLDGMPIAIELLGRVAQPESDLAGLRRRWERHRTDLLRAGSNPDRLLSVAVSFDLSIASLDPAGGPRRLLGVLSHLPDGVAAEDLGEVVPSGEDAAAALRGAGLAFDEHGRLRVLKPIRDHVAAHHPADVGDAAAAVAHYVGLIASHSSKAGRAQGALAVRRLLAEAGNLMWAVGTAIESESPNAGIDAAISLATFSRFNGLDAGDIAARALARAREIGDRLRQARANEAIGDLAVARSEHDQARAACEEALSLFRELENVLGEANCVKSLGDIALAQSDHDAARTFYEQALALYRDVGVVLGEANCVKSLGNIALEREEVDAARTAFEQASGLYEQIGNVLGEANCITSLGDIALRNADLTAARDANEQALALYTQSGNVLGEANCITNLGDVALREDDLAAACAAFEKALPLYEELGNAIGEANCVRSLGDIALRRGEHVVAREHYERALEVYSRIPEPYSIGFTHLRLAPFAEQPEARAEHLTSARAAWTSIDRPDLVARYLDKPSGEDADRA
jgi:tetratricopeptide (TPR) repeat protein